MSGMHLKQSGFTYSACGPFITNKERIKKLKETEDLKRNILYYIRYQNKLDKACFRHNMLMEILKT